MRRGLNFSSATAPHSKQKHSPGGPEMLKAIIRLVAVLRAIAIEYRTAIAAEEAYWQLRSSNGSDLARPGLRHDQLALVIKRLYCGHD